ncbi:S8 family serine peptidase [Microscilla marina]|uniref:S8 family serine peptidase n=1 Tax=Microscilla marina TaxID=1027 RepID=UPI0005D48160|nr:S8 family serine peptidase [Microscilla marina]
MYRNQHLLLRLIILLTLIPFVTLAQQPPDRLAKTAGATTKKMAFKVDNYSRFVQDMQAYQAVISIVDYNKATQTVTVKASPQAFKKYIQSNRQVRSFQEIPLNVARTKSTQKEHDFTVNQINRLQNEFPALTGEGMLVSLHEPLFNTNDIDLRGRFISKGTEAIYDFAKADHPTNMATFIAGAGNSSSRGKGVAWKANLTSSNNADTLPESDTYYQNTGIIAQNHSYGLKGQVNNVYDDKARAFDLSANNNDQLLHVVSSGNDGTIGPTEGNYKGVVGYANLSGSFKMAKNILHVGAISANKQLLPFSSKGPAYDGRIKPELVAYGGNGGDFSGTSNAAAITTGMVTLLQQAYQQQKGQFPSATLLRAVLINSAEDVATTGVDFKTGYGNINVYRAHQNLIAEQYVTGTATQGNTASFDMNVPANATHLKITLVWNDPAAAVNASKALVNDLDLSVTQATNTWLPWVLKTAADTNVLALPATRGEDHLNTIEQVTVENPVAGTYTIRVKGHNLAVGNQDFYVAYQWEEKDKFVWTFPTASDNMHSQSENIDYFRWESTFAAGQTGKLELSLDNGQTWEVIAASVDLSQEAYRWEEAKDTFALAMARMTINTQAFATETFTLSKPLEVSVGFNCGDSVMIQWEKAPNIQSYTVYAPGARFLRKLTETTDTVFIFYKNQLADTSFTIVPNFNANKSGIQAIGYDYRNKVACYIEGFFAQSKVDTGIVLNLTLATTYGIKSIVYERKNGSVYEAIATVVPGSTAKLTQIDFTPFPRLNSYRARILFNNGQEVLTEVAQIHYLDKEQFIFFPNPVTRNQPLNIFSKNFQDQRIYFKLYNAQGKVVYSDAYSSDRFSVDLSKYPSGLYYYRITTEGAQKTGKLILE